jgi:hypothetical protein
MLLTVEDHDIIVDMVEAVLSEVPNDQQTGIRGEMETKLTEVAVETGNAFQPLALAIAHLRNTTLKSTHFVSFI